MFKNPFKKKKQKKHIYLMTAEDLAGVNDLAQELTKELKVRFDKQNLKQNQLQNRFKIKLPFGNK